MRFNLDDYVTVSERVGKFYAQHPMGRIITTIIEHNAETGFVLVRAEVYRAGDDALPAATGHAYEIKGAGQVQQGSYVEVCETSAVGRALALLGFEVKRSVASREDMEKVVRMPNNKPTVAPSPAAATTSVAAAPRPAAASTAKTATKPETSVDVDEQILESAGALGYDAAKVGKWINQKYAVTAGLGSLTENDKLEVLRIFREKAKPAPAK